MYITDIKMIFKLKILVTVYNHKRCGELIKGKGIEMLREVSTKYGRIRGIQAADPRITAFKGIPFAKPPVGEYRWRPPVECEPWEGVKLAYDFAPISVQDRPGLGTDIYCREWHVDPEIEISEDCLYLNVWTPAKRTDEKLPVLVWYFGGGLQWGYPSEMEFDGERLARRGIIVVSVNYRLNIFGFAAHPQITAENPDAPSNFGYLDQQAGTRWVKENIAAFGGDPDNITIAGQSAGGGSVMCQLTNLDNKGLFNRAIVLSGVIGSPYRESGFPAPMPLEEAEKYGEEFFKLLGVSTLEEARKIDADTILAKYNEFNQTHGRLFTILDNKFVKGEATKLCLQGEVLDVPIMAGNTADEFLNMIAAEDEKELEEKAGELFGNDARIFMQYEEAKTKCGDRYFAPVSGIELSVKMIFEALKKRGTDNNFYYYRFNPDIPGEDNPGTFHSVDLWFFFETLAKCTRPYVGRHYDLARQMANYWANFIKTGNPNGKDIDGTAMQEWLPYTSEDNFEIEFTSRGPVSQREPLHEFKKFLRGQMYTYNMNGQVKKQAFNPYLPSWEYVPDGEPYVFGDRVYIYGSHDYYNGDVFCMGDYVCWSAPVDDMGNWRYEGVIYTKYDDPLNDHDGSGMLYAPDMTVGPDGRYYLYYALSSTSNISVAVCDTPAGKFEFYGHVHYADGTLVGNRPGDEHQFDPGVLTEGDKTYLYTGFCAYGDKSRHGAMGMVLDKDMLTVIEEPVFVVPSCEYSQGTGFEGHEYFEAASIRKMNGKYIFVYSSIVMHELCYAVSDNPMSGFKYGGVLCSNSDLGIDTYKPADWATQYGANNHGSIIEINGKWYVFYHRHTNGTWYSRQVCAEKLEVTGDCNIKQAEITSCGLNDGPLKGEGYYPAYIACNMFYPDREETKRAHNDAKQPDIKCLKVVQDGADGDENDGYIANFTDGAVVGFKYFDCKAVKNISVWLRGYAHGTVEVRTRWDGECLGSTNINTANVWEKFVIDVNIPDGVNAIYLSYKGGGNPSLRGFRISK